MLPFTSKMPGMCICSIFQLTSHFILFCNVVWYSIWLEYITICNIFECMHAQSLSDVQLFMIPDCSPTSCSGHGISQGRTLEWVASSKGSSQPRYRTRISCSSCTGRQILYHWTTWGVPCNVLQYLITMVNFK